MVLVSLCFGSDFCAVCNLFRFHKFSNDRVTEWPLVLEIPAHSANDMFSLH